MPVAAGLAWVLLMEEAHRVFQSLSRLHEAGQDSGPVLSLERYQLLEELIPLWT
jgi:hypothetical protein